MVPLIGHANIMRYACIQSCRIDVGVVYVMIIRISVQLGLLDVEEKTVYQNVVYYPIKSIGRDLIIAILNQAGQYLDYGLNLEHS